ncbi:McrC family protein [Psychrobacillus sp. FSL K6-1415]|uniref:McrC family protein n=1 Tax=Psychrobacillus sp. FSL K6-1415 TaxID=2921544 RepID=UPI0030F67B51
MKDEIILQEYNEHFISGYHLTTQERNYLKEYAYIHTNKPWEQRFFVDELREGLRVRTTSYVGIIELERLRIIIQPKFDPTFAQVIDMMLYAQGNAKWWEQQTVGSAGHNNLFILLVTRFIEETELLLRKGLKKDYIEEDDNLRHVRGRISIKENALKNYNLPTKIYCSYDELVNNIKENQVILRVLELLTVTVLTEKLKRQVHKLRTQFEILTNTYQGNKWPHIIYNRLNDSYKMSHVFGKMLFENLFLQNYMKRQKNYFALLVNMNEIFEQFVGELLKQYLQKGTFKVMAGKRITDAMLLDGERYRDIIPDLVVQDYTRNVVTVLDTKYKGYDLKRVSTEDVFQLSFYAQYYQNGENYAATIVYPVFKGTVSESRRIIETNKRAKNSGLIYLQSIHIMQTLEWIREMDKKSLHSLALRLIGY